MPGSPIRKQYRFIHKGQDVINLVPEFNFNNSTVNNKAEIIIPASTTSAFNFTGTLKILEF